MAPCLPYSLERRAKGPAMHNVYSTGLQLIDVLGSTLTLLIVNGLLFITTGAASVMLSRRLLPAAGHHRSSELA